MYIYILCICMYMYVYVCICMYVIHYVIYYLMVYMYVYIYIYYVGTHMFTHLRRCSDVPKTTVSDSTAIGTGKKRSFSWQWQEDNGMSLLAFSEAFCEGFDHLNWVEEKLPRTWATHSDHFRLKTFQRWRRDAFSPRGFSLGTGDVLRCFGQLPGGTNSFPVGLPGPVSDSKTLPCCQVVKFAGREVAAK